jgi:hypothetical protein
MQSLGIVSVKRLLVITLGFVELPLACLHIGSMAGQEAGENSADVSTSEAANVDEPHVKKQGSHHA